MLQEELVGTATYLCGGEANADYCVGYIHLDWASQLVSQHYQCATEKKILANQQQQVKETPSVMHRISHATS